MYRNILFDSVNAVLYNTLLNAEFPVFNSTMQASNPADEGEKRKPFRVDRTNVVHMGLINAVAGVVTAIVDYPLDVLKTNIQAETLQRLRLNKRSGASASIDPIKKASMIHMARVIIAR
jgi:hypothetical protein